jgi:transcriptional regulator GlxA family with amidase domain
LDANLNAEAQRRRVKPFLLFFLISFFVLVLHADQPQMNVGFLALHHVYNSELMAPYDVFHHTKFHVQPGMRVFTISLDGKPVETFEGLKLQTDYSIDNAPSIDILVIPSAEHNMDSDLQNGLLQDWIRKTSEKAKYVVTLCDGAFLLANTGLLDAKKATTFPTDVPQFRKLFPKVNTLENYTFVHDEKFLTSQGGAKSYDVAMYLVDLLYGEKVAAGVGKGLILPWKNPALKYYRAKSSQ